MTNLALDLAPTRRQPNGLKVVLFAGGGGSCTGIEAALRRLGDPSPYVDVAVNHDPEAVAMHRANHPHTRHYCNNVWRVRPQQIIDDHRGRPIDLLWASPDCKHFSKAKGGKPVEKNIRDLAWIVLAYAKLPAHLRPLRIFLENVEEFRDWSPERQRVWPMDTKDKKLRGKPMFDLHGKPVMEPDPSKKGETFKRWVREHRRHGYRVELREIRASTRGAPTIRNRLYIVMECDGLGIDWGHDTHGAAAGLKPLRTAAECIDFSLPYPSIFMNKRQAKAFRKSTGIKTIRPLATATECRIARGVDRFVLKNPTPFLVPITHTGDSRVHSIDDGLRSVTCAQRGEISLVQPFVAGLAHGEHKERPGARSHELSDQFRTIHAEGGNHALVAPVVTNYKGDSIGSAVTTGMPTVTANSFQKRPGGSAPLAVTSPVLVRTDMQSAAARNGIADPSKEQVRAITSTGGFALAAPVMVKNMTNNVARSTGVPLGTSLTGNHHAVAASTLIQTGYGERDGQAPRALDLDKPLGTPVAGGVKHAVIATSLVRQFGNSVGAKADEPAPAVMPGGGGKTGVIAAHLAQNNTGMTGHDAREPVSTIVQKGCTQSVVASHLVNLKGSDRRFAAVDGQMPAQCAQGTHLGQVYAFLVKYHRDGGQHAGAADPMPTAPCNDSLGVVTVEAIPEPALTDEQRAGALRVVRFLQKYGVLPRDKRATMVLVHGMPMVDIGLRMLKARELFNAQGFPPTYIIDRGLFVDPTTGEQEWRPLTGTAQVRMCGNSVCPPVAEDLIFRNWRWHVNDNREIAAEAS